MSISGASCVVGFFPRDDHVADVELRVFVPTDLAPGSGMRIEPSIDDVSTDERVNVDLLTERVRAGEEESGDCEVTRALPRRCPRRRCPTAKLCLILSCESGVASESVCNLKIAVTLRRDSVFDDEGERCAWLRLRGESGTAGGRRKSLRSVEGH